MRKMAIVMLAVALSSGDASAERLICDGQVRDVPKDSVVYALRGECERIPKVWVRDPSDGAPMLVDEDHAEGAVQRGWWRMTDDEIREMGLSIPWRPDGWWKRRGGLAIAVVLSAIAIGFCVSAVRKRSRQRQ